jgi:prepilin-type N-terminal cleavage/methylation domain-containing protein
MLTLAQRRGVSLVELLVTMAVGGIALSLVAAICLRQQRTFTDLAQASAVSGQLRDAAAILPIDLRSISSVSGDIRDARDTSLEIRATIATAVVCDTMSGGVVLSPPGQRARTYASLAAIEAGDTVWRLATSASSEEWSPHRVEAVHSVVGGVCHVRGPQLGAERSARRVAIALDSAASPLWIGMPLRVTRPLRYSLYRSSDGAWALGARDWSGPSARFNTIQPVAGPFLSAASRGLRFEYFDSVGALLPAPVANPRAVALIRIDLRGQTKLAPSVVTTSANAGARVDSVSVWVSLRNRR